MGLTIGRSMIEGSWRCPVGLAQSAVWEQLSVHHAQGRETKWGR